jgi:MFS family permease
LLNEKGESGTFNLLTAPSYTINHSTLISERMGRRANITLYSVLYVASTLWCILHPSIPHVLTARVLMGIGTS